ncbi:MAG: GDP-mannose 4,6-dehydratase [Candidatus Omnitrophica bacterium]|nr:GDP-mannose 4,6-dehydratase [Candidatus Omnitrophota bacterium]
MVAFLKGYNLTDGLKSNPCTYEFKNFKTNSATLAMGVWYLIDQTIQQRINLTVETKEDGRIFYSLNLLSPADNLGKENTVRELVAADVSQRGIQRKTGISRTFIRKIQNGGSACLVHHLQKSPTEVKKIIEMPGYGGWFYDLETSSGEFHCGIGKIHVHNSPRRGEAFVTRKISLAVARIKKGLQKELVLGNLDAKRDWGYAKDYVEAMWLMLQQKRPDDYVIATGRSHTIRDFLKEAFGYVNLDYRKYVRVDKRFFRPIEVNVLCGDYSKARKKLGWKPKTDFKTLVRLMVDADLEALEGRRGDGG